MKKYLVLISILALTACGGGSGGGHGDSAVIPPNDNMGNEFIGDNTDNNQGGNTGNESDNSSDNNDTGNNNSNTISSIDLSELEQTQFTSADGDNINFIVDNGIITAMLVDGNTYILNGKEYTSDYFYDGNLIETEVGTFELLGTNLKLQYSDFGYMLRKGYIVANDFSADGNAGVLSGGIKKYEIEKPEQKSEFKGTAIAAIMSYKSIKSEGDAPVAMVSKTNDAKLVFDGENQILTMNFSKADNPWYDVVVKENVATVSINDPLTIAPEYLLTGEQFDLTGKDPLYSMDTKFYGENGVATEVISTTHFGDQSGIWVSTAFGGKK